MVDHYMRLNLTCNSLTAVVMPDIITVSSIRNTAPVYPAVSKQSRYIIKHYQFKILFFCIHHSLCLLLKKYFSCLIFSSNHPKSHFLPVHAFWWILCIYKNGQKNRAKTGQFSLQFLPSNHNILWSNPSISSHFHNTASELLTPHGTRGQEVRQMPRHSVRLNPPLFLAL